MPVKGMASYKHFKEASSYEQEQTRYIQLADDEDREIPVNSVTEPEELSTKFIEEAMIELSSELGLYHFRRNEIECICCESLPRRYLGKKDMFNI